MGCKFHSKTSPSTLQGGRQNARLPRVTKHLVAALIEPVNHLKFYYFFSKKYA
jgi:hypothetical protein